MGTPWVSANGRYYDAGPLFSLHMNSLVTQAAGSSTYRDYDLRGAFQGDVSGVFYKMDAWNRYCVRPDGQPFTRPQAGWDNLDPTVDWQRRDTKIEQYHRYRGEDGNTPSLYAEAMNRYSKGYVGWREDWLASHTSITNRYIRIFNNIYYVSTYSTINSTMRPFDEGVSAILLSSGTQVDYTGEWKALRANNTVYYDSVLRCMNQMFFVGVLDTRESVQCQFSQGILLAATVALGLIILVKFLSALSFGVKREPEDHTK